MTNESRTWSGAAWSAVLVAALAPAAPAQWDRLDREAPHVVELVGATNLILERWPEAARHYELLLREEPDNAWAHWFATRALREAGRPERALELGDAALERPLVRAPVALELARCAARTGDEELARVFLTEARTAQLVVPARELSKDADLKGLRRADELRELVDGIEDVPGRFARLADAGDLEALGRLWRANAAAHWEDLPSNVWILKDVVDAHGRALDKRREDEAAHLGQRLERGARAADEAFGISFYVPWIERARAWSQDERREDRELWKRYARLDGDIRGHRFGRALDTMDELDAVARRLCDAPALFVIDRTRGLVHAGILNYGPPRKGVTRTQEYEAGRAAFRRYLDTARKMEDAEALVDAYDFLATFEVEVPQLSLSEAEQLIFAGIIATARIEPTAREFGMFERMWRDLQAIER